MYENLQEASTSGYCSRELKRDSKVVYFEMIEWKSSEDKQIGQNRRPSPIWLSEEFFHHIISNFESM